MTKFRALALGLLASTALATPALAQNAKPRTTGQSPAPGTNATDVTAPPAPVQQAQANANAPDQTEIVITATKREENLQNVPISVQAIGTRRLDQLNITNFEDYTKQLPSVSYQTSAPGFTVVYMRGVATGGDGNHSGSLPSVAGYIDNVFGQRRYRHEPVSEGGGGAAPLAVTDLVFDNANLVKQNFNDATTYGGRAALKIDLDDNWTISPAIMHQHAIAHGVFFEDADQGDLQVQRFRPEITEDQFTQVALTIEGKI